MNDEINNQPKSHEPSSSPTVTDNVQQNAGTSNSQIGNMGQENLAPNIGSTNASTQVEASQANVAQPTPVTENNTSNTQQPNLANQTVESSANQSVAGSSIYDIKGGGVSGVLPAGLNLGIISLILAIISLLFSFVLSFNGGMLFDEDKGFSSYFITSGILIFLSLAGLILGVLNQKNKDYTSIFGLIGLVFCSIIFISTSSSTITMYRLYSETKKYDRSSYNPTEIDSSSNLSSTAFDEKVEPELIDSDEGSVQDEANDSERMADIKLLSSCFEAYYANNGYYPSLDRVNNLNWRETELGAGSSNYCQLSEDPMIDPESSDGSSPSLASLPAAGKYHYQVSTLSGESCEVDTTSCQKFVVGATLDSGEVYEIKSIA